MLNSIQQTNEVAEAVDFYLDPPIEKYGILDLEAIDEIAEVGYTYTREKIAEWKGDTSFNEKIWACSDFGGKKL